MPRMEFNKKTTFISVVVAVLVFTGGLFSWENNQSVAIAEIKTELDATKIYQKDITRRQDEVDKQLLEEVRWIKEFLVNNFNKH